MASELHDLLSPLRVRDDILPLDSTAPAARFEGEVRDAILLGVASNPAYRWEMVQVWAMCFLAGRGHCEAEVELTDLPPSLDDSQLANVARRIYDGDRRPVVMGAILAELGFRRVRSEYRIATVVAATAAENERLVTIVGGCAHHCPFDKRGDAHLHALIRLLLPPAEEAAVGEQTPFDAMDRSYDKQTSIKLVRPLFEQMPSERAQGIVYTADSRPCDLALVCGVVGEHIDDANMDLAINGRLLTRPRDEVGMFAFRSFGTLPDGYGVYRDGELLYSGDEYPLCSVVKEWARCTPGAADLFVALTAPGDLRSSSKFKRMLIGD